MHPERPGNARDSALAKRRIRTLVVDDSAIARRTLCNLLATLTGVEVIGTAASGCQALAQVETQPPDLLVMDIQMPDMDGLEATRRLRQMLPGLRIILVTMHDTAEVRKACQAGGAHGFVPKHRLYQELAMQIAQLFADAASGA